jgi:glycine/D-amino acid oxidase-like deaminating enzyme
MTSTTQAREVGCDLMVVGGGAAGLSGAVTAAYHGLKVVVAEKAPVLGGATSWSGGWMWAPLNLLSQADGIVENMDQPRTYLKHALGERYDEARVEALLENSRHMVAFFEKHTSLQFVSGSWIADIQGHLPGAGSGGRSVGPKPINARRLKKELRAKLRSQLYETSFLGMGIMAGPDLQAFLHATTSAKSFFHAGWRVAVHAVDMATTREGMQLVNGTALIARLAKSADDLGVGLWVNSPATRLVVDGGKVTGALVSTPEGEVTVHARLPERRRTPPHLLPPHPDRPGTLDPGTAGDDRRRDLARRVRGRPAGHLAGLTGGLVPGVPGAVPQRPGRYIPAHRRPREARADRRALDR